jgi:hypothetical protein
MFPYHSASSTRILNNPADERVWCRVRLSQKAIRDPPPRPFPRVQRAIDGAPPNNAPLIPAVSNE